MLYCFANTLNQIYITVIFWLFPRGLKRERTEGITTIEKNVSHGLTIYGIHVGLHEIKRFFADLWDFYRFSGFLWIYGIYIGLRDLRGL